MAQAASKTCEICVRASGSHYCLECEQYFCENCKTFHNRQKISKTHQFQSSSDVIPEGKSKCKEHNEDISFVCKTCNVVVCSSCVTGSHTGHAFSKLLEHITQLKKKNTQDLRNKVQKSTQNMEKMEESLKEFDLKVEEVVKAIIEEGTKMKAMVDKCIAEMIASGKDQYRKERDTLTKIMAETKMNLKTGIDLNKKIYELDKTRNDGKLLKTLQKLNDDIAKLTIESLPDFPNIHYTVKSSTVNDIRQLFGIFKISDNVNNQSPKRQVRADESTQDEIKRMINLISSIDWRETYQGIEQLLKFCETHAEVVAVNATKIFDNFLPRLQDPNSKVNLFALQVFQQIIPLMSDYLAVVLNKAMGNVAPNLSSKNKEIYNIAIDIISALMQNIDGRLLLQPLANQAQSANTRSKPDLVVKVAELVRSVYSRNQKPVVLHVLPLLWHLLGATNSRGAVQGENASIRTATHPLVHVLYSKMGSALIDQAHADANVTRRHLDLMNELLER